jgi:hypothetical protein
MLTKIIFTAIIILLGFRAIYLLQKAIPYSKKLKHHLGYIIPVLELFAWFGFILWCISYIYDTKNYLGLIVFGIILILISIPTFFLLRDFLFGVYLKIQRKIDVGRFIEFGEFNGQIEEAGHFNIDLKNVRGDIITVPYSKIRTRIILKHSTNSNLLKQKLVLNFPESVDIQKLIPEIEKTIWNTPWSASSQKPIIQDVKFGNGGYMIEVYVFTIKKEHAEFIRKFIHESLAQENSKPLAV